MSYFFEKVMHIMLHFQFLFPWFFDYPNQETCKIMKCGVMFAFSSFTWNKIHVLHGSDRLICIFIEILMNKLGWWEVHSQTRRISLIWPFVINILRFTDSCSGNWGLLLFLLSAGRVAWRIVKYLCSIVLSSLGVGASAIIT